jgi:hypothetical protein
MRQDPQVIMRAGGRPETGDFGRTADFGAI